MSTHAVKFVRILKCQLTSELCIVLKINMATIISTSNCKVAVVIKPGKV